MSESAVDGQVLFVSNLEPVQLREKKSPQRSPSILAQRGADLIRRRTILLEEQQSRQEVEHKSREVRLQKLADKKREQQEEAQQQVLNDRLLLQAKKAAEQSKLDNARQRKQEAINQRLNRTTESFLESKREAIAQTDTEAEFRSLQLNIKKGEYTVKILDGVKFAVNKALTESIPLANTPLSELPASEVLVSRYEVNPSDERFVNKLTSLKEKSSNLQDKAAAFLAGLK